MRFSDGLPINLRYPVQPKPKPPLPVFSIPKTKPIRNNFLTLSPSGTKSAAIESNKERKLSMDNMFSTVQRTQRNFSIPSDDLMNQVGLSTSPPSLNSSLRSPDSTISPPANNTKKSPINSQTLKTRSPRKNILIDGVKSLTRSKTKNKTKPIETTENNENALSTQATDEIAQSLKNLTFSGDFKSSELLYNVPTNNSAVRPEDIKSPNETSPLDNSSTAIAMNSTENDPNRTEFFTQSDKKIQHNTILNFNAEDGHERDNSVEEIYFVEAPTKSIPIPISSTSFNYVTFKQTPYFPHANQTQTNNTASNSINNNINNNNSSSISSTNNNNNSNLANNNDKNANSPLNASGSSALNRSERVHSIVSCASNDSDFILAFFNQSTQNGNGEPSLIPRPNYYIPKSSIQLTDVLGEGEFGSVHKGIMKCEVQNQNEETHEYDIPVAIKTLHNEHCQENRAEFLREASVMIKLSHHCIVKLIGISKVNYF